MNKNILNEIRRVNEVMGLSNHKVINEQVSPALISRFLKFLANKAPKLISLADNPAIVKIFQDENFYLKYADDLSEVAILKSNDDLLEALTLVGNSPSGEKAITKLLMSNKGTRDILLQTIMPKVGTDPAIFVSGVKRANTIKALNDMGIIIDEDMFVKLLDDIYYPNGRGYGQKLKILDELNPVRVAVKTSSKLPKNIFFKSTLKGISSDKGEVLTTFIKKYADNPKEVADVLVDFGGMSRREANKIRLALEKGDIVENVDQMDKIFKALETYPEQSVRQEFVTSIIDNKAIVNRIQTEGSGGGLMNKSEIKTLLGTTDDIAEVLSDNITEKATSATTKLGKTGQIIADVIWTPFKKYGAFTKWAFGGKSVGYFLRLYRLGIWYLVSPTFFASKIIEIFPGGQALLDMFKGKLPGGDIVECLRPDSSLQAACNNKSYIYVFLKNEPECDNQALDEDCTGVSSTVYYDAAEAIAIELGTYREIVEPEEDQIECAQGEVYYDCSLFDEIDIFTDAECGTCVELDANKDDWEMGVQETGWYTGSINNVEGWWGTALWMSHSTNTQTIKKILNERGSLFGIAKIATSYYENTSRNLWDDMTLMSVQGTVAQSYYSKIFKWFVEDETREKLLDIAKSFYTWGDGTTAIEDLGGVESIIKWSFPPQLYGATGSELWKPCFGGTLPVNLQVFLQGCDDGACNSDGISINNESDISKISAEDWNTLCRNVLDFKFDLYNLPMKNTDDGPVYSPNGSTTYACTGNTRPTDWDTEMSELESKFEGTMTKIKQLTKEEKKIIGLERVLKS